MALDPNESYLFYTDAGYSFSKLKTPKIERVLMDGNGRQVIIKDKLLEPIAITVDPIKKRIFWLDRKYDHLETSDYNGIKRFIIASGSLNLPHSISLDLFESTIFYADLTKMALMKLTRHTVTSTANVTYHYKFNDYSNQKLKQVKIFHQTKQPRDHPSPCVNNSGCEHFCLLSHSQSSSNSYRCKCKIGYQLSLNLKSCEPLTSSLLLSQLTQIRGISVDQYVDSEYREPLLMPRNGAVRPFDVDCRNNRTFFFDPIRRAIFQNTYKGEIFRIT